MADPSLFEKLKLILKRGEKVGNLDGAMHFPSCILCNALVGMSGYIVRIESDRVAVCKTCYIVTDRHLVPLMTKIEGIRMIINSAGATILDE